MTMRAIFWTMMLIWLIFGILGAMPSPWITGPVYYIGNSVFLFILFGLLGWKVFDKPIQG